MKNYNLGTLDFIPGLRLLAGFSDKAQAADYFGVSLRTWQRWERQNDIGRAYFDALRGRAGFVTCPEWSDCRFLGNRLHFSDGQYITRGEARNMWIYRQLAESAFARRADPQGDLFEPAEIPALDLLRV